MITEERVEQFFDDESIYIGQESLDRLCKLITGTPPMPKVKDPKPEDKPVFDTKNTQYPTCDVTLPRKEEYRSFKAKLDKAYRASGLGVEDFFASEDMFRAMKGQTMDLYDSGYATRKEVISIRPGDVMNVVCAEPKDNVAFLVPDGPTAISIPIPAGSFRLEVYREQGKQPTVAMDTGLCDVMGKAIIVGCTIEAQYNTKTGLKDVKGVIEFEIMDGLSLKVSQDTRSKHGCTFPKVLDISGLRNMKIIDDREQGDKYSDHSIEIPENAEPANTKTILGYDPTTKDAFVKDVAQAILDEPVVREQVKDDGDIQTRQSSNKDRPEGL